MKRVSKRLLSTLLAFIMVISIIPSGVFTASAVTVPYKTGDSITLGSYPQTKVTDPTLITALNKLTPTDDTVTYSGAKYKKVFFSQYIPTRLGDPAKAENSFQDNNKYYINTVYWFKYEPIKWRVLSNKNSELFVMSEKILEARAYNLTFTSITWDKCSLRAWLNSTFFNAAFSFAEQLKLKRVRLLIWAMITAYRAARPQAINSICFPTTKQSPLLMVSVQMVIIMIPLVVQPERTLQRARALR